MMRSKRMCWSIPVCKSAAFIIAQIKQKYGIIERENYNKPKSEYTRQPKCPPEKEAAITDALKYLGMI